jgi:hypothetical protein
MKAGAILPVLPPRAQKASTGRCAGVEKTAPVLELRLEIRAKPDDQTGAQAGALACQNETDAHESIGKTIYTSPFVAQVLGQIGAPDGRRKATSAYGPARLIRTSYLYDRCL